MNGQLLLCTDLDRTLIPNGPQPESPNARRYFSHLISHANVTLAYVTGRHRELVDEAIQTYQLPRPDYVIGDVGSSIYELTSDAWCYWSRWEDEIATDWAGKSPQALSPLFQGIIGLQLQERAKQGRYKLSYYLPLKCDYQAMIAEMYARLEASGIQAALVHSVDEAEGIGLLDVLPAGATKCHAIQFLMSELGFDRKQTLFSGDSGNDLAVLSSPIQAVLVRNSSDEVRAAALQQAKAAGHSSALYLAQGGWQGMNGNYSAGILEGIMHYMPELESSLWGEQ